MNVLGTRFKPAIPLILAFATFVLIALAAAPNSASAAPNQSQDSAPSGLSAQICGDSVCLLWTPGSGDYAFQQVSFWLTGNAGEIKNTMLVHPAASKAQVNLASLDMPSQLYGDTVSYTFQVTAVSSDSGDSGQLAHSNTVSVDVPVLATIPLIGEIESVPVVVSLEQVIGQ